MLRHPPSFERFLPIYKVDFFWSHYVHHPKSLVHLYTLYTYITASCCVFMCALDVSVLSKSSFPSCNGVGILRGLQCGQQEILQGQEDLQRSLQGMKEDLRRGLEGMQQSVEGIRHANQVQSAGMCNDWLWIRAYSWHDSMQMKRYRMPTTILSLYDLLHMYALHGTHYTASMHIPHCTHLMHTARSHCYISLPDKDTPERPCNDENSTYFDACEKPFSPELMDMLWIAVVSVTSNE